MNFGVLTDSLVRKGQVIILQGETPNRLVIAVIVRITSIGDG